MKKCVLCILDGWGIGPENDTNAIYKANTPNWDMLLQNYPWTQLQASQEHVGLPAGQMGNSEVGHMNIGAGQIIQQDLPRLNKAFNNIADIESLQGLIHDNKTLHIMGLFSSGGVHSHMQHWLSVLQHIIKEKITTKIWLHLFLDGRDTSPRCATQFLQQLNTIIANHDNIAIATIGGRFYGMDRDNRWERIQLAYDAIVSGNSDEVFSNSLDFVTAKMQATDYSDEFVIPACNESYAGIANMDNMLVMNFRADRIKQILFALLNPEFIDFQRKQNITFNKIIGLVKYDDTLQQFMQSMLAPLHVDNTLGEIVAKNNLHQLRIAETEKYAHVTYFFNCGRQMPFPKEDRILVNSPKVRTYDLAPAMSAYELTDKLQGAIAGQTYDLIVVNYANGDMVGHTGNMSAAIKAVEVLDDIIGKLLQTCTDNDYTLLITADHGNVDEMYTDKASTAHSLNPVPLVAINVDHSIAHANKLSDIAPLIIQIMGLK